MVIYPITWATPLSGCAVLGFVAVVALGVLRRRVRFAETIAGFVVFPLAILAACIAVGILWFALANVVTRAGLVLLRSDLGRDGMPVSRFDVVLLTAASIIAVGIAGTMFAWSSRWWSWHSLGLGALGWWLAATVMTSLWLPGASYAFLWPLLAILAGQAVAFAVPRGSVIALVASWLAAIPLLLIHLMILPGLFHGLNLQMAAVLVIPVLLFAGALLPMAGEVLTAQRPTA